QANRLSAIARPQLASVQPAFAHMEKVYAAWWDHTDVRSPERILSAAGLPVAHFDDMPGATNDLSHRNIIPPPTGRLAPPRWTLTPIVRSRYVLPGLAWF